MSDRFKIDYGFGGRRVRMSVEIQLDREVDGRWIGEIPTLAGVLAYGATRDEAVTNVKALARRVVIDRLERGEA